MANSLFDAALQGFLDGQIRWTEGPIKALLIDRTAYAPSPEKDTVLRDIPSTARVAMSPVLTGKSSTDGVAGAHDVTFESVHGEKAHCVVLFQDAENESAARLIALIDDATGLPFTPNGGDFILRWDRGPNKIFRL